MRLQKIYFIILALAFTMGCTSVQSPRKAYPILRSSPPLSEVWSEEILWLINRPVTVKYCEKKDLCRDLAVIPAYRRVRNTSMSLDGLDVLIWFYDENGEAIFDIYETTTGHLITENCMPIPGVKIAGGNPEIKWTIGKNILLTWTAGSFLSEMALFDIRCNQFQVSGSAAVDISPGVQYATSFIPINAPLANNQAINVWDLSTGENILNINKLNEMDRVLSVSWEIKSIVFSMVDKEGKSFDLRYKLEKKP